MFHAKKARATIRMLMRTAHHSTTFPAFECFVIFIFGFLEERKHNMFPILAQCNAHEYIMFACMIFKISQQSKLALEEKRKSFRCLKYVFQAVLEYFFHLKFISRGKFLCWWREKIDLFCFIHFRFCCTSFRLNVLRTCSTVKIFWNQFWKAAQV